MPDQCVNERPLCSHQGLSWKELPKDARANWEILGFTKRLWDRDLSSRTAQVAWEDLSSDERIAAEWLGYDGRLWMAYVDVGMFCSQECGKHAYVGAQDVADL